jgi:hypothetical protein
MKYLVTSILLYTLISCGSEKTESQLDNLAQEEINVDSIISGSETDTTTLVTPNIKPSISYSLSNEDLKSIKPYLNKAQISSLNEALKTFRTTEKDIEIIGAFQTILQLTDSLKNNVIANANYEIIDENEDYYPFTLQTELSGLEHAIPGFMNTCVAECTEYDCSFELSPFLERANETLGNADNEFFEALHIANGERMTTANQFKAWFAQFWDYGGATFMGSEIHLKFLKKVKDYNAKYQTGNDILNSIVQDAYVDIQHGIYMNSPEKVASEMYKIITLNIFTPEQNAVLNKLANQIDKGDFTYANCVGGTLQFNCETGDCDFGG